MNDPTSAVVVGIDGTERSEGAVRYAVREARRRHVAVRLVHVVPTYVPMAPAYPYIPDGFQGLGRRILRTTRAHIHDLAPGLPVSTELSTGGRVAELLANGARGQLLVLGRETVSGLERLLSGATTASVAARSTTPVVSVPQDWRPPSVEDAVGDQAPVVVGFKQSRHDHALLAAAFARAEELRTSVLVVHAWKIPALYDDIIEARTHESTWMTLAEEEIERELGAWREAHPDVPVEIRIVHAKPAAALIDASRGAALVLVVRPGSGRFGGRIGSTIGSLLRAAHAPVEVVPADEEATEDELVLERSGIMLR